MVKKGVIIIVTVVALLVAAGIGVLVWWLLRAQNNYETIRLEGEGLGYVEFTAAYTRIPDRGDMFWWFYPAHVEDPTTQPILLWINGVTGLPPSFLANFLMFGPYDANLNRRQDSWLIDYNLLFIDAPLGTGFSTVHSEDPNDFSNLEDNIEHLLYTVRSFYDVHGEYRDTALYLFGQGDGSQLAIPLAIDITKDAEISSSLKGIFLGNAIISPALALTKLGFYLEELAYIDGNGRNAIEAYSILTNTLVNLGYLEEAFDQFSNIDQFVNDYAGAVAVNLDYIVEKLTQNTSRDFFGEKSYLQNKYSDIDMHTFMQNTVARGLGIPENVQYDGGREAAVRAFKGSYMESIVDKVEKLLQNTDIKVIVYNGNLDAVSNTPGQLEWVNNLQWAGQSDFLSKRRTTFVINNQIEGYIREAERLQFYWINVAGYLVPLDNPVAMKRMVDRGTNTTST